jgi:hypothetical protein
VILSVAWYCALKLMPSPSSSSSLSASSCCLCSCRRRHLPVCQPLNEPPPASSSPSTPGLCCRKRPGWEALTPEPKAPAPLGAAALPPPWPCAPATLAPASALSACMGAGLALFGGGTRAGERISQDKPFQQAPVTVSSGEGEDGPEAARRNEGWPASSGSSKHLGTMHSSLSAIGCRGTSGATRAPWEEKCEAGMALVTGCPGASITISSATSEGGAAADANPAATAAAGAAVEPSDSSAMLPDIAASLMLHAGNNPRPARLPGGWACPPLLLGPAASWL